MRFEIKRHNDPTYDAPRPWHEWDEYAGCWVCFCCGAAAGFQTHGPGCAHVEWMYRDRIIPPGGVESLALQMLRLSIQDDYVEAHVQLMLELLWAGVKVTDHGHVVRIRMKREQAGLERDPIARWH